LAAAVSLYLDENVSPKISIQLRRRGIHVVTVRDLGLLGDADENHLARATRMGYVLVTCDTDFLALAASGLQHAGIIFGVQEDLNIGDWVKALELICAVYTADDMANHIEYL
jgi:predicted nuclease of predicted toxin-antitoxin system